jgi:acetamidase/formamidase
MSKRSWQTRSYRSFIYRLVPIRVSLACCRKIPDFRFPGQRRIGQIGLKPEHLISVIAQRTGLLAGFKADPPIKSP